MASAKLASAVARLEGKKSQTSIGGIRETLKVLEVVLAQDAFNHGATELTEGTSPFLAELFKAADKHLDALWKLHAKKNKKKD